jgi:hypothetical protein
MAKTKDAFSRSGETCMFGKCTAELPKVRIPEEALEIIRRKAVDAGFASVVEYLRYKALIDAYGLDTVIRVQTERLSKLAIAGEEKGIS